LVSARLKGGGWSSGGLRQRRAHEFGAPATAQFGLDVMRKGDTLVVVGLYGGTLSFPCRYSRGARSRSAAPMSATLDELHEVVGLGREGRIPAIQLDVRPLDAGQMPWPICAPATSAAA
jgi:hypothetical protein